MASMRELSDHIISVARDADLPVTNLQVQKIMFFSLGMHIKNNGGLDELALNTYDIPFEKWQYGPVVETEYYRLNHFKEKPITIEGHYSEEYQDWDETIIKLLKINVFDLVKVSHEFPSWADYKEDILNRNYVESYSIREITRDFING
jgi:uncharacterized phage-associated protein